MSVAELQDIEFLKREDLSFRAKGLLAYLLILPRDYKIKKSDLINKFPEGDHAFNTAWSELRTKKYINNYSVRDKGKISEWITEVYSDPSNNLGHDNT